MNSKRMHAAFEFRLKRRINHTMALKSGLPAKWFRYNIKPEMGFASAPMTGMAGMEMRFINHPQTFRRERRAQLLCDAIDNAHGFGLSRRYLVWWI